MEMSLLLLLAGSANCIFYGLSRGNYLAICIVAQGFSDSYCKNNYDKEISK